MPVATREDPSTTLQLPSTNRHPVFFTAKPTSKSSRATEAALTAAEAGGGRGGPAAAVPALGIDDDVATHKPLSQIAPPPPVESCITSGGGFTLHVGGDND